MSYCRLGSDSQVYVYAHVDGDWVCDDCPRLGHHREPSPMAMATHLLEDKAAGYKVPDDVIDALRHEVKS